MMYLVSRTVTQGRRAGLISLTGIALGFLVYLTATNVGLSALFVAVPDLYLTVKLAGACYLGWLAFKALRPGGVSIFAPTRLSHDSGRRLFSMGLMTALLNPKIAVMYLSLIPQFERPAAGHLALQGFTLGALQILVSLTVNFCIVLAAGTIARIPQRATRVGPCAALRDGHRARRARGQAAHRPREAEPGLRLGGDRVGQCRNDLVGVSPQGRLFCVMLQVHRELVDTERL